MPLYPIAFLVGGPPNPLSQSTDQVGVPRSLRFLQGAGAVVTGYVYGSLPMTQDTCAHILCE
jgi:hypothetical protein